MTHNENLETVIALCNGLREYAAWCAATLQLDDLPPSVKEAADADLKAITASLVEAKNGVLLYKLRPSERR